MGLGEGPAPQLPLQPQSKPLFSPGAFRWAYPQQTFPLMPSCHSTQPACFWQSCWHSASLEAVASNSGAFPMLQACPFMVCQLAAAATVAFGRR